VIKARYSWNVQVEGKVKDQDVYRHILKNRGISDPDRFFSMGEESLYDPFLLSGMERAVSRVIQAIASQEKILIYGDYDCDGISAISVLYRTLRSLGARVEYDLPDRFQDGYGLNLRAVGKIIASNVNLVITVDNGITCHDEVAALKKAGIDTIVTDHHEDNGVLPDAYQILHAKYSPEYPFKEIAGVMVAYKLASAIADDKLADLYDLVMIGTIADLMPLVNENQAMVNLGLKQLRKTKNLGLKKLLEFSHLELINETAIAFKIAPKINSSGRLGKALEAVRLLVSESEKEVNELIFQIEENHANRKDLTSEAVALCESLVDPDDDVLVVASPDLHEGVIGICAQKLAEKYQKSTLVITIDDAGIGKGSMRSFGHDNILEMLMQNQTLLNRFGGHAQAAGLQIIPENIPALRAGLNTLSYHPEVPVLNIDMELSLANLEMATVKKLQDLSFFTATFLFSHLEIVRKQLLNGKHTKLQVSDQGKLFDVLSFNNPDYFHRLNPGDMIDVVGGVSINTWKAKNSIQVIIKDLRCDHFQILDFRTLPGWEKEVVFQKGESVSVLNDAFLHSRDVWKKQSTVVLTPRTMAPPLWQLLTKEFLLRAYRYFALEKTSTTQEFAQAVDIEPSQAEIVLSIFLDLGFLEKNAFGFVFQKSNDKKELADSANYRSFAELSDRIEALYNLSVKDLIRYFPQLLEA
jgi:single-stranded-DNA-specific exonuclease